MLSDLLQSAPELTPILGAAASELDNTLDQVDWAEEEIAAASRRHPTQADVLFHTFSLLKPQYSRLTHRRMTTEFVFRAHCRELLGRVIAGEDTRPGTAVEALCALGPALRATTLTKSAIGLYIRMWKQAFPDRDIFGDRLQHYEALEKTHIDDHETWLRDKLANKNRQLTTIDCKGQHHREWVTCRYADPSRGPATRPATPAKRPASTAQPVPAAAAPPPTQSVQRQLAVGPAGMGAAGPHTLTQVGS
ncbi:hypothetical protein [Nonomuraea sp. NPDC049784]|uniref:hypothetical protein n=1 Tax=Nonomuraea sp. NPDC049784 TaxID=3154361 RepID=UPI0033C136B4